MNEHRQRLALEVQPVSPERFEILAITAGSANGWEFPVEALRESLALWEGVNCFIDHDWNSRSVRDIAGVLRKASWDEQAQGIAVDQGEDLVAIGFAECRWKVDHWRCTLPEAAGNHACPISRCALPGAGVVFPSYNRSPDTARAFSKGSI